MDTNLNVEKAKLKIHEDNILHRLNDTFVKLRPKPYTDILSMIMIVIILLGIENFTDFNIMDEPISLFSLIIILLFSNSAQNKVINKRIDILHKIMLHNLK